uniref:ADF-H domain-containing protein n=1 Tax=Parascaris equorum TaxID=6256 RepID=A0A914RQX5_PAREQ
MLEVSLVDIIHFADDRAPVREKMLVAATRATFKAEFGQYEYHVTNKNDISLEAFERWLHSKEEPAPLSEVEKEIESAHRDQKISLPSAIAAQTLKGIIIRLAMNVALICLDICMDLIKICLDIHKRRLEEKG